MPRTPTKAKSKPKNEEMYTITVPFINECTYEEREGILRRAIIAENNKYEGRPFRFIVAEKDMKLAKVNIFVRKKKGSK
jgi:hypothetical protein